MAAGWRPEKDRASCFSLIWPGLELVISDPPDVLQQRIAPLAFIGQHHKSVPITAAVHDLVCE